MIKNIMFFIFGVIWGVILMCLLQINKRGDENEI